MTNQERISEMVDTGLVKARDVIHSHENNFKSPEYALIKHYTETEFSEEDPYFIAGLEIDADVATSVNNSNIYFFNS